MHALHFGCLLRLILHVCTCRVLKFVGYYDFHADHFLVQAGSGVATSASQTLLAFLPPPQVRLDRLDNTRGLVFRAFSIAILCLPGFSHHLNSLR